MRVQSKQITLNACGLKLLIGYYWKGKSFQLNIELWEKKDIVILLSLY